LHFIIRTTNGGIDWGDTSIALSKIGNDIEFINGNPALIWATDYNYLYFSKDTGKTWTKQVVVGTGLTARDIEFVNETEGWVLCDKYIYYTDNLGGFITDVDKEKPDNFPKDYSLLQNYPNPFNPTTSIKYSLPEQQFVSLKIFDILGKEVATLVNENKPAGNYEMNFDASNLTSGVYFYQLRAGSFAATRKLILMK